MKKNKSHPHQDGKKYFLEKKMLDYFPVYRWINHVGYIIGQPEPGITIIHSPMGGQHILKNALVFNNRKECRFMKNKLNSEIVKESEPQNWALPTWQETYAKTHPAEDNDR